MSGLKDMGRLAQSITTKETKGWDGARLKGQNSSSNQIVIDTFARVDGKIGVV